MMLFFGISTPHTYNTEAEILDQYIYRISNGDRNSLGVSFAKYVKRLLPI